VGTLGGCALSDRVAVVEERYVAGPGAAVGQRYGAGGCVDAVGVGAGQDVGVLPGVVGGSEKMIWHRRKLSKLLSDVTATVIVVEYLDRLARFGVEYLQAALAAGGRQLVVLDETDVEDDLVGDVTEVLTGLCARLFGRRWAKRRAEAAVKAAVGVGGG